MSDGMRSGVNWMRVNVPPSALRERRHGQRLAEAGDAFEEAVAAGEQADEHPLEDALLADDDAPKLDEHLLEASTGCGERLGVAAQRRSCSSCHRSPCSSRRWSSDLLDLLCDRLHVGVGHERVTGDLHEEVTVDPHA